MRTRWHSMSECLLVSLGRRGMAGCCPSSKCMGLMPWWWIVHSRESDQFTGGWDALVTDQPGVTVAVRTADCVPVLVHDPRRRVVAAIHAGWRGAVAGIVSKTLTLMATSIRVDAVGSASQYWTLGRSLLL